LVAASLSQREAMSVVKSLPLAEVTRTVESALGEAARHELERVLVLGMKGDGEHFVISNNLSNAEIVWMLEQAKTRRLGSIE
jgi:hypothetical protein